MEVEIQWREVSKRKGGFVEKRARGRVSKEKRIKRRGKKRKLDFCDFTNLAL